MSSADILRAGAGAVPVLDLARWLAAGPPARAQAAEELAASLEGVGFLLVTEHGVDPELTASLVSAARTFFALPLEEKMLVHRANGGDPGYYPPATSRLAQSLGACSPPDLKEGFAIAPLDGAPAGHGSNPAAARWFPANVWPVAPASLRTAFVAYYQAMETLCDTLLTVLATGLGLPETWFAPYTAAHTSTAAVLHYPPQSAAPEPGQLRAGAHTDYGTITVLHKVGDARGLQVQGRDGQWQDVVPPPGHLVVNIGDLLAEWTGGRWASTMHRVVNPAVGGTLGDISIPFFHQPDYDAIVRPMNAPSNATAGVLAGRHLAEKVDRMHAVSTR